MSRLDSGAIMRVLVVDDDPEVLAVIEEMLSTHGFEVTGAGSADRARVRLAAKDYDLLLIDAPQPMLLEIALAHEVRAGGTPVLMMPAGVDEVPRLEAAGLPYIKKPFTPDELLAAIRTLTAG
jgi:DNA-binding response OmpR family regulator